jgi:NAD(P)H-dependent FMN reductase
MYMPIILGTAREGRQSEKAAKFMLGEAAKYGLQSEIIDVRSPEGYAEKITKADGLIIVSPEYNHGYPGALKQLLDTCYKEYEHKPVGICGVSSGILGGARMVEQLRQVVIELHMVPIREAIYFSSVAALFDESGAMKDASYAARVKKFLDELAWYAGALKAARG